MNIRLITKKLLADLQTPVGLYLKIRDLFPESALLESSDFHGGEDSSSFIALEPLAKFKVQDHEVITEINGVENKQKLEISLPIAFDNFMKSFKIEGDNPTNVNGFFGYTSYDSIRYFETVQPKNQKLNNADIPEFYYIFYRFIFVINHLKNELIIVENIPEGENSKMEQLEALLQNNNYASYNFKQIGDENSFTTGEEYLDAVKKGIAHCKRGDVFQIVLSRCFSQAFAGDDFKVYRALRSVNPSPYLFYFDFGVFRIFGSSPETHCKITQGHAYIDPIAGTYKRTGEDEKDKILSEKLLKDEKENAEHVMLVDLARNDLSRNCSQVRVDFYKNVQYFSHVIHLVSRVSGKVEEGKNNIAVFADTFPAGTLSGAPKVRAMQLIYDIEKHTRGAYGGCIGYIGINGDLNQAITIRSFMSRNNTLYYQAGAGVVSKSNPEEELQEVNNKLGALKRAVNLAETLKN
ncbi:anthranilate synthase component I family protein [Apibacter muscae]|uniref:Anthranilate synthase component 1 n=1 Tax=Apibacter muscae TaxID=2509004 RepID=A0A563DKQ7_9FLAO|nr:anthranilate synthase component I family protein [Apibacter muscae]TWP25191.1 anthranilate synthase component I family protein [Apibacter muscae]TWP30602.1 anthranilate synthase component I family protein [Apibacter muscae]TWP31438.1 anthranilate synthase component I family protein [Apibacter muscae]